MFSRIAKSTVSNVTKTTSNTSMTLGATVSGVQSNGIITRDFSLSKESSEKEPVKVAVTGAAGAIGYALLFRIASGDMLGKDQPVILHCLELPHGMKALQGVTMELQDCAFPLVHGIVGTNSAEEAFDDVDYAMFVGAKPRGPGMERGDLLADNGKIFQAQGTALNNAKSTAKALVVGNPANTNALILARYADKINPNNIAAMTRLDENRAVSQLAEKLDVLNTDIDKVTIWGNHSATQYPDLHHATVNGTAALEQIDEQWYKESFIPRVQKRGAEIIDARGASSAASAASAAIDSMRDWALGSNGKWVSLAVPSDGSYGIDEGVYYSYPGTCENGEFNKVMGLEINEYSAEKMEATYKELKEERDAVAHLL